MNKGALFRFSISMIIFGTVGLFVRFAGLSSSALAVLRGFGGAMILLPFCFRKRDSLITLIKRKWITLCVVGACIGINWVFLFEAYRYTTVAVATLCYYMAPVFVYLFSSLVLKEKQPLFKHICMAGAVLGAILVSDIFNSNGISDYRGIVFGLLAAVFYASGILCGRTLTDADPTVTTTIELFFAAMVVFPYALATDGFANISWNWLSLGATLTIVVIHTGIAYLLYFGALPCVQASQVALISYIDPAVALFLSVFILQEETSASSLLGGAVILLCTGLSGIVGKKIPRYYSGEEARLLEDPHRISFYNGILCIRHPFTKFTSCANFFCIFLNGNKGKNHRFYANQLTIKHEFGHILQARSLGFIRFWFFIAIPSMRGYFKHVPYDQYYNQPWERGADFFGGVERMVHSPESLEKWEQYYYKALPHRKRKLIEKGGKPL